MRAQQILNRQIVALVGILVVTLAGASAARAQTVTTRLRAVMGQKVVLTLHNGQQVLGRLKHGGITRVTMELSDKTLRVIPVNQIMAVRRWSSGGDGTRLRAVALSCLGGRRVAVTKTDKTVARGFLLRIGPTKIAIGKSSHSIRWIHLVQLASVRPVSTQDRPVGGEVWRPGSPLRGDCEGREFAPSSTVPGLPPRRGGVAHSKAVPQAALDAKLTASADRLKIWGWVLGIGGSTLLTLGLLVGLYQAADGHEGAFAAGMTMAGLGGIAVSIGGVVRITGQVRHSVAHGGANREARRKNWLYGGIAITITGVVAAAVGTGLLIAGANDPSLASVLGGSLSMSLGVLTALSIGLPMWLEARRLRLNKRARHTAPTVAVAAPLRSHSRVDPNHERGVRSRLLLGQPRATMFATQFAF